MRARWVLAKDLVGRSGGGEGKKSSLRHARGGTRIRTGESRFCSCLAIPVLTCIQGAMGSRPFPFMEKCSPKCNRGATTLCDGWALGSYPETATPNGSDPSDPVSSGPCRTRPVENRCSVRCDCDAWRSPPAVYRPVHRNTASHTSHTPRLARCPRRPSRL
jgi:hypothetical protein